MADTDLQVKFTADIAELSSAAATMQATLKDIAALVQSVNAAMASTTGTDVSARQAAQYKRQWDQSIGMVTRDFAKGLVQMAEGSKSFGQVMASVGQQILLKFAEVNAKVVSDWLFTEATKTAATNAGANTRATIETMASQRSRGVSLLTAEKTVFNEAVKAAAGAYSAMAGIPVIGPLLGAAAATATFAAVEAYGALASAAGGYDIPSGVNPLVQAHANEMILPASIANPLRAQLAAANFNGPRSANDGGGRSGDTHIHNWHLNGVMDGASLRRILESNRSDHAAAIESLVRSRNGRGFGA